jgi:para-nitrobenzyl esterase
MDVIVDTAAGKVRGTSINSIQSFKGIPYGASTGGSNRFQPPVKPQPWPGVRDALQYGPRSTQPTGSMATITALLGVPPPEQEGEDCLSLNVLTPAVGDGGKRPVLFWCHGGGFTAGSGAGRLYNGTNLPRRGNVVVVTVNHRLGPFGYLYLGDLVGEAYVASGNVGMLDLVAALEWVRDNIEAFGGDPGNVTIFGESGGGAKVSALLAMPVAHGLFHRAMIQSGPGLRMMSREKATDNAAKLLKTLEIAPKDIERLSTLSVEQILEANARVNRNPLGGWGPVVDGRVLPQHPFDPVAPALSANVPLVIGTNKDEATLFLLNDAALTSLDEAGLRARIGALAGDATDALLSAYRHAYPHASPGDLFTSFMTDRLFRMHSIAIAERKYEQGSAPVFMYLFTWETPVLNGRLKSTHALEIPFMFDNLSSARNFTGESPELVPLAERMSEVWLAFARDGKPGYRELPSWPAYDLEERATMIFDTDCRVENDPGSEVRRAWQGIPNPAMSES